MYAFIEAFIEAYKYWKPTQMDSDRYYGKDKNELGSFTHRVAKKASESKGHPFRLIRGFTSVCVAVELLSL